MPCGIWESNIVTVGALNLWYQNHHRTNFCLTQLPHWIDIRRYHNPPPPSSIPYSITHWNILTMPLKIVLSTCIYLSSLTKHVYLWLLQLFSHQLLFLILGNWTPLYLATVIDLLLSDLYTPKCSRTFTMGLITNGPSFWIYSKYCISLDSNLEAFTLMPPSLWNVYPW